MNVFGVLLVIMLILKPY